MAGQLSTKQLMMALSALGALCLLVSIQSAEAQTILSVVDYSE